MVGAQDRALRGLPRNVHDTSRVRHAPKGRRVFKAVRSRDGTQRPRAVARSRQWILGQPGPGVAWWRAHAYTWRMLPVTLYVDTPRPALTANDARSKCHWTILRAKKNEMAWQVAQACKAAKIGRLGSTPIDVTITWFVTDNRRRDSDALGPFTKAALDTLVDRGVIDDDNYRIVRSTKQCVRQSDTARIEILLREEQEDD